MPSRIAPPSGESARPHRRRRTPKQRAALLAGQGGLCAACGASLEPSAAHLDHWGVLWITGDDSDGAIEAICVPCHREKTKADQGVIGHIKRIIARQDGTRRPRKAIPQRVDPWPKGRTIPSRPFR